MYAAFGSARNTREGPRKGIVREDTKMGKVKCGLCEHLKHGRCEVRMQYMNSELWRYCRTFESPHGTEITAWLTSSAPMNDLY